MKTTIGGDRLGSGNKQEVALRNYERSSHDLSFKWRSSMAAGTLVPFMSRVALPGDKWDIDLMCEVLTLPTIGPLFGSFKVQLDVFQTPIRLYNGELHMNKLGIGMDMSNVFLPQYVALAQNPNLTADSVTPLDDNEQINPSCLWAYLGLRGLGRITGSNTPSVPRYVNAVPLLVYWDIYKNYYANKQEERGFGLHTSNAGVTLQQSVQDANIYRDADTSSQEYANGEDLGTFVANCYQQNGATGTGNTSWVLALQFGENAQNPIVLGQGNMEVNAGGFQFPYTVVSGIGTPAGFRWVESKKLLLIHGTGNIAVSQNWYVYSDPFAPFGGYNQNTIIPRVTEFPLDNIDNMKLAILRHPDENSTFLINASSATNIPPYNWFRDSVTVATPTAYASKFSQEGLGLKTYQSDLFNNWIDTDWIDGPSGVNVLTAVNTTGNSFTIDALNLAQKVYKLLNRIAISGGTYDDWLDATYTHDRMRSVESPMYMGSLIKELAFQEVVSNANTDAGGVDQPLGTLAGRGKLTGKHKGGKIKIKVDEPSYITGIVSITPRVDYSQGNQWDISLKNMNEFHKPALDAIGFQDLITEQMAWQSSTLDDTVATSVTTLSAGKQPAWINYMTEVNRTYGNFADQNKEMFMTNNRRYEINPATGAISDLTTYIDPSKYNHIFAQTNLDAQNFWVQLMANITARRKMSAKVIPNL